MKTLYSQTDQTPNVSKSKPRPPPQTSPKRSSAPTEFSRHLKQALPSALVTPLNKSIWDKCRCKDWRRETTAFSS